jgi:hypothetical protein
MLKERIKMITKERVEEILSEDRTKLEWAKLLDSVKVADMDKDLKSYFIDEIQFKIDGVRHSKSSVLADIEAGSADVDDIGGY